MHENYSLRKYNTFGIDVSARYFSNFTSVEELDEQVRSHAERSALMVMGGGSNILLTRDFDGLVLKNDIKGISRVQEDNDHVYIRTGAGENWHGFVSYCIQNGLAGVENLSLIPGNTGASPMQNIGAYGAEIKDVFYELEAYDLKDRKLVRFSKSDCEFGYRDSVFKGKYKGLFAITSVTYRLNKIPVFNTGYGAIEQELERMKVQELNIAAISEAVINIRKSKLPDPAEIGNAGSFFKNPEISKAKFDELRAAHRDMPGYPVLNTHGGAEELTELPGEKIKLAAGWLIEQCGWKGYREGDAGCHARQALVLVNYGNATGGEIYDLSGRIIRSVEEKFGVRLETEVNVV